MADYTVKATNIQYDIDHDEEVGPLPSVLTFNINDVENFEELETLVSDAISDETGFCHLGFSMTILSESASESTHYPSELTQEEEEMNEENDYDDFYEPYAEYGEDFEEAPVFEKTNRQKGIRKVRD